jgi:inorganic phosphate transporter, PiT family
MIPALLLLQSPGATGEARNVAVLVLIVAVALVFDFCNGFNDSANSIATLVSTRVLPPSLAVAWAAFFNFAAAFILGLNVAGTIATKIVEPQVATNTVVFSALIGAIVWDVITWYFGIPASSSHALIGGFIGAGLVHGGASAVQWNFLYIPLLGIVLSPTLCLALGFLLMIILNWICRNFRPKTVHSTFKGLQLLSSAVCSISHGGNDAQKTIGIIAALLVAEGRLVPSDPSRGLQPHEIPYWIVIAAFLAITLGTLSGGWRIVKTVGTRITKLDTVSGFAASLAGGTLITGFTELGFPVSTTHSVSGAIMGVGAINGLSAVRWGVSARIVWAWIITIPASGAVSALCYWLAHSFGA